VIQRLKLGFPKARGTSSIPDQGAKIPCASWPKPKQKQYCHTLNKDLNKLIYMKKKTLKKYKYKN